MLAIKFARHRERQNVYEPNRESSSIKSNDMFTTENPINNLKCIKRKRLPNFEYIPVERNAGTNMLSHAELV